MATDEVMPEGKWDFDDAVTSVFEDMLRRSIPQYDVMRQSVFDLACQVLDNRTTPKVLDLGCSRGDALAPFVEKYKGTGLYYGCDVSEPMLEVARERFAAHTSSGRVRIENVDLRREFPGFASDVTLAVLCVQFVPIEYRQEVVWQVQRHLSERGCFIMVEKVLGAAHPIDRMMVQQYLGMKARNGYTQEQIDRKRLSLEGVLVPVTAKWNEELLREAGFREVDCFWRWMNFAGWIALK